MEWSASPSAGVWRKRLELDGPKEAGRVTSVVRYDAGSEFHSHPHPDGEEILVLSGVFTDERGDHPAGTFMLNPEGYEHAPRSAPGCTLFVKLRQYPGLGRTQVRINTREGGWESVANGVERMILYREREHPETIQLVKLAAGVDIDAVEIDSFEAFVIDGAFSDDAGSYRAGTWVKSSARSKLAPRSDSGCLLYLKKPITMY